jgi:hypothetical protein
LFAVRALGSWLMGIFDPDRREPPHVDEKGKPRRDTQPEGFRRKRDERLDKRGVKRQRATHDAYPTGELPPQRRRVAIVGHVFQTIDTDGLTINQFIEGMKNSDERRLWFTKRLDEANDEYEKKLRVYNRERRLRKLEREAKAKRRPDPGQSLVEFALILPIFLALLAGIIGMGFFYVRQHGFQTGVDTLAAMASDGTDRWKGAVADENKRWFCQADPLVPTVTYPDQSSKVKNGDRMVLAWTCHIQTSGFLGINGAVTVLGETVIAGQKPVATPLPSGSLSPSPKH